MLLHKQGIQPVQVENIASSIKGRLNIYNQLKAMLNQAKKAAIKNYAEKLQQFIQGAKQ